METTENTQKTSLIEMLRNENLQNNVKGDQQMEIGDTVQVDVKIIEGDKERIQSFQGVIIAMAGSGIAETITVRRVSHGMGVERIFPIHSPRIAGFKVTRKGLVRRAKLYYLRDQVGKDAKIKERRFVKKG